MKADKFYNEFRKALKESLFLKTVLSVSIIVIIGQFLLITKLFNSQRIILVPTAKFYKDIVIEGNEAPDEYYRIFIRDALKLLTTFTPKDVEQRYQELLYYISPQYYSEAQVYLVKSAQKVKSVGISQFSEIQNINIIDPHTAIVNAYIQRFISGTLVKSYSQYYLVKFHMDHGRFYIDLIKPISSAEAAKLKSPQKEEN